MTNLEFQEKLKAAFESHVLMKGRDQHTINELLYVLEHNEIFKEGNFNISIWTLDGRWLSIPCLDAFVSVADRGMWFNDANVEYELDGYDDLKFDCITVHETERSDLGGYFDTEILRKRTLGAGA